jgi:sec-independent protein translocase protein TatA
VPGFIGIQEIVLLVVLLLLIFGAKRLPDLGRSLGGGMREFKDGVTGRKTRRDIDRRGCANR